LSPFSFTCRPLSGGPFLWFIVAVFLGLVAPILVGCVVLVLGTLVVQLVVLWALPCKSFLSAFEAESLFPSLSVFLGLEPAW